MSQSTDSAVLISDPVFDPTFLDITLLREILASASGADFFSDGPADFGPNAAMADFSSNFQHDPLLAAPGSSADLPVHAAPLAPPPPSAVPLPSVPAVPYPPPPIPAVPPPRPLPHTYHNINTTIQRAIAATIQPYSLDGQGKKTKCFRCIHANCAFTTHSKPTALTHVRRKHFGDPKLYACSCTALFACKDSAKRHCDTRNNKVFECALCLKKFARRDYRLVHQRKCSATLPPPQPRA